MNRDLFEEIKAGFEELAEQRPPKINSVLREVFIILGMLYGIAAFISLLVMVHLYHMWIIG